MCFCCCIKTVEQFRRVYHDIQYMHLLDDNTQKNDDTFGANVVHTVDVFKIKSNLIGRHQNGKLKRANQTK